MTTYDKLLALLALSGTLVWTTACTTDDDDTVADDDDTTAAQDDDDAADDDDATAAELHCDGLLPVIVGEEPNDDLGSADLAEFAATGFCYEGEVECGAREYVDLDLLQFNLTEDRQIRMVTAWTGASDVDGYLWARDAWNPATEDFIVGFDEGFDSPEDDTADLTGGTDYIIQVACWDGIPTPFTVTVTYEEIAPPGDDDDDDSAGDDDDSATGDDDDSATGDDDDVADDDDSATGDDDDSATGDDDDSAAGDDDDVADDDDDSATGDDDDSATGDDDDSATGDDDDSAAAADADADGYIAMADGGDDCDDGDAAVNPGAAESDGVGQVGVDDDCDGGVDEWTYTEVYNSIVSPNCGCHQTATHSTNHENQGSAATGYANWTGASSAQSGIPLVDPGNPDNSYIWRKLDGSQASVGGSGSEMPLGNAGAISASQEDALRAWILSGAPND